jgi:hypothetical protein
MSRYVKLKLGRHESKNERAENENRTSRCKSYTRDEVTNYEHSKNPYDKKYTLQVRLLIIATQ